MNEQAYLWIAFRLIKSPVNTDRTLFLHIHQERLIPAIKSLPVQ
jgi:hypothetical protein